VSNDEVPVERAALRAEKDQVHLLKVMIEQVQFGGLGCGIYDRNRLS
jgi:hypothetical protein